MADFDPVVQRVQALSRALDGKALDDIAIGVGVEAKKDVRTQVRRDIGTDEKMTNWGRFKFRSGFELTDPGEITLLPRPIGPWKVLEQGRKGGHKIPKGRRRRKTYRTPAGPRTVTRDSGVVGSSSRGKRTSTKAALEIEQQSPRRVQEETRKVIARHIRGT